MINKSLILKSFVKTGEVIGTGGLFYTFMKILRTGEATYVEPNMAILIFEVVLSALSLTGSINETGLFVYENRKKNP